MIHNKKSGKLPLDDPALSTKALEITTSIAGIGIYDWDMPNNKIIYSQEYEHILGYTPADIGETITIEKWAALAHPDDLPIARAALENHFLGKAKTYQVEMRMLHKNGEYVWTKALGRTIEWTKDGKPKRFIGAHQNIDEQKKNYEKLKELLQREETSNQLLEEKIRKKTDSILQQDKILWAINDITRNLMITVSDDENLDNVWLDCLKQYCAASGVSRITLWKNFTRKNKLYCSMLYDWDQRSTKNTESKKQNTWKNVLYEKDLPSFLQMFDTKKSLNVQVRDLLPIEQADSKLKGIQSVLAIPLFTDDEPWGFIAIDNCNNEEIFSEEQERLLTIFGSLLAHSIQKKEIAETVRELNSLNFLMLDSLPIGSNIWDKNLRNIACNQEVARIFEFPDKQAFLDNFHKIHPEFQPNGKPSMEYAAEIINKAFDEGYLKTEWQAQTLSGKPVPIELTLTRLQYGSTFVVLGYTKDLREERAIIAEMRRKDDMLLQVNKIAKKLLSYNDINSFDTIVRECLQIIGETTVQNKVFIWKDMSSISNKPCCSQIYEWYQGVKPVQEPPELTYVPYTMIPTLRKTIERGTCLNSFITNLSKSERLLLGPQGIKTILIAPIKTNEKIWGFIGINNCTQEKLFTELEENMLLMSGSLIASAVVKRDSELLLRESEEYNRLLIESNPVTCMLWDETLHITDCNEATLNLFGVDSVADFSKKFSQFSPEFQQNGERSETLIKKHMRRGFSDGYTTFDWQHKKSDGTYMPSRVTLVRQKYQGKLRVAAYIMDMTEIKANELFVQTLFDASPLMNILYNKDYQLILCNQTVVQIFGLADKQEYLDKYSNFLPQVQPDGTPSVALINKKIKEAFETGLSTFDLTYEKSDKTPIPTNGRLVRIRYRGDYAVAGYIRDLREEQAMIAEIRKNEEELKIARDEAISQSKAKSNFLAKMSHEIRTPMNAILGMSELILRDTIPPQIKSYAMSIKQSGENLLSIINDVLDFSKIESGKFEITEAPYLLSSLINDITSIIRMRLIDKPVLFVITIDPRLPNKLFGDETRLRQIVLNILSNAVKYTREGHIVFSVSGETTNNTASFVFTVSDTGIGIKADDLDNLFGEFVQADKVKNKGVEGTGLGLAITKNLCEAMGGSITVSSTYEKGSVFTITIPQQIESSEPFALVKNPEKHSVLVYEPRETYAKSIIASIKALDVQCISVITQSDFFEKLKTGSFTFVFVSSFLFETTKKTITKLNLTCTLVLLAEYGEDTAAAKCRTIAMPAHAISIANILNNEEDSLLFNETDNDLIRFSAPESSILIVDDIVTNLKVAEGLLLPYEFTIDTCESGREALELAKNNAYDIIFMDHMMPEMNGVEATEALRKTDASNCKTVPIVALTANAVLGMKEYFLANGFTDYLAKPIDTKKLGELLDKWIPKEKKRPSMARKMQNPQPVFTIDGIDVRAGISLTGGTTDNYLKILQNFYFESGKKIQEIEHFFAEKNLKKYIILMHALKSALASIGAKELSDQAKLLEAASHKEDMEYVGGNTHNFLHRLESLRRNISLVISKDNAEIKTVNTNTTDAQISATFSLLKHELETMNVSEVDKLLNSLVNKNISEETRRALRRIERMVLLSDYDEAIAEIDVLLKEDK